MSLIEGAKNLSVRLVAVAMSAVCSAAWSAAPLTLEEAVRLASENAPQVAAQRAMLEAAQSSEISAGRLPDPQLVLGLENVPVEGPDAYSMSADFMTMRRVGVMQEFPNARKRSSERQRAAASTAFARRQKQQTQLEVSRFAAQAWIDVYVAELTLERVRALEAQVKLQADTARATLASGRGMPLDALMAQSAVSEWTDRVLEAQREVHHTRAELARWVGDEAERPLSEPPAFEQLAVARERLLAFGRHAELLAFDSRLAVARSEVEMARAERRPDWSMELSYANRGSMFDDMASLEFRVGLPLFTGARQDPLIAARRAEISQLEAERDMAIRMHDAEIRSEIAAWEAARERKALFERERLPLAHQQSQAALAAFQAGRVELAQVLAAHVAEAELQRDYAELTGEIGRAWVFLRYLEAEHASP